MAYKTFPLQETYGPRKGLEGPFRYANGRTLYYDPKEGQYWDPTTDFYLENEEILELQGMLFNMIKG